jgi:hypothetical protein
MAYDKSPIEIVVPAQVFEIRDRMEFELKNHNTEEYAFNITMKYEALLFHPPMIAV